MSLEDELRQIVRQQRLYASMREGGTKKQKELGVLCDLIESLEHAGQLIFTNPSVSPQDPPDCVAQSSAGGVVAFEVTELVSQEAIEWNERARPTPGEQPALEEMVVARWPKEALYQYLADALRIKDSKVYRGGPYSDIMVVVYTDEPLIVRSEVEVWLSEVTFGPFERLTGAYLLYRYEPPTGYPFQALRLVAPNVA